MPAKRWISGTEMPASLGVHGPGEMTICSGAHASICSSVERVVAMDMHVRAELAQVLDEVVGEAVVVVDHQEHRAPFASYAAGRRAPQTWSLRPPAAAATAASRNRSSSRTSAAFS